MRLSVVIIPAILLATAQVTAQLPTPGSVLVYTGHSSGLGRSTIISVTNTSHLQASPVSLGGTTTVRFDYVNSEFNPADPLSPLSCHTFSRLESLSPGDTLSVMTSCHNAATLLGQDGYVVVSAINPTGAPFVRWSHNWLVGSLIIMNASGSVYALNAIPFQSPLPQGDATDLNQNGRIDFDGFEYQPLPDVLIIPSFVALMQSHLTLINFTGGGAAMNSVVFTVWNDNEVPLQAAVDFKCWFDLPLQFVSPLFSESFLQGLPNDPSELDLDCDGVGDVETGWATIDSVGVTLGGPGTPTIANDGALLGSITAGQIPFIDGGHLLWSTGATQFNGSFHDP